ncbi:Chloroperoxidase [Xylariaceae sp. FL0255]|nr:Chloroperoxidase [Xylariaceae sp. FL0255]
MQPSISLLVASNVLLILIAGVSSYLVTTISPSTQQKYAKAFGQKAEGHNDLFYPEPDHPIPYKLPFTWDERNHYYEKRVNGSENGYYRRSSCPAVNALANRGYINRSGRNISFEEIAQATRVVWNFGDDNILVVLEPTRRHHSGVDRINLDMLADDAVQYDTNCPAAPTRNDRELGDNVNMNMTLFKQLLSASKDGETLTLEDAAEHHHRRHNDSKLRNPEFRFGNQGAICSLAQYGNMFGVLGRMGRHGLNTLYVEDVEKFYLDDDWPVGYARRELPFYSPEANSYIDRMAYHLGYEIQRPYPAGDKDKGVDIEPETARFQLSDEVSSERNDKEWSEL